MTRVTATEWIEAVYRPDRDRMMGRFEMHLVVCPGMPGRVRQMHLHAAMHSFFGRMCSRPAGAAASPVTLWKCYLMLCKWFYKMLSNAMDVLRKWMLADSCDRGSV